MGQPGKIGKYEILDKIGEGGFGVVYKGRDPFIKRLVAVKTCTSEEQGIQRRFFREAEIAGNLHHVNVVTIHDFGVEEQTPYLVQEYLDGDDLDTLMERSEKPLTVRQKVRYLRGIAEGLGYAHSHGVIHRDVKPSNVRILKNGRVKVMDFGIAKLKDQESRLTQTGMTMGTVAYLSPEQLKGEKLDHRADIFSFGIVAYELFTGRRPFHSDTISKLFQRLLSEPPPPLDPTLVPAGLIPIVERCLEKNVEDRYPNFGEVIADLDEVRSELPGDPEVTNPFWPRRRTATSPAGRATRLVGKVHKALAAKDLTVAEMTLNIARRELEAVDFERDFGPLIKDLEQLKKELAREAQAGPRLGGSHPPKGEMELEPELQNALREINEKLDRESFDDAAIALFALEQRHPDLPELQPLRDKVTRIHRIRKKGRSGTELAKEAPSTRPQLFGVGRVLTRGPFKAMKKGPRWRWALVALGGLALLALLALLL